MEKCLQPRICENSELKIPTDLTVTKKKCQEGYQAEMHLGSSGTHIFPEWNSPR